jgi:hypothetical protein
VNTGGFEGREDDGLCEGLCVGVSIVLKEVGLGDIMACML